MKKKILALLLTVVLMGALLSQIDVRQLGGFIRQFSFKGLLIAFGVYALSYYFRALRWSQLIHSKEVGMRELWLVTCAHIMFNNLLPSRTGEMSYIYLLKTRHGLPGSEGLATLLVSRLYDFAVMAAFFLISVFFFVRKFSMTIEEIMIGSAVLLGAMVFLIFNLNRLVSFGLRLAQKIAGRFGGAKWVRFVLEKGRETEESLSAIRDNRRYIRIGATTALIWGTKFLSFYILMNAILHGHLSETFHVTYWMIVLGTTAAELTTVLPVHGVGGFGTYETAWAGAFFLLGFTKELAIKTALSFHILGLLYSVILGTGALLLLRLNRKNLAPVEARGDKEKILAGRI
jgi:hypothetical protein